MDNILHDLKTLLILSFLIVWEWASGFVVGLMFLFFDLESLNTYKEYISILVWFLGAIAGVIYLFFRAYDMIMKALKSRIEKKLAEKQLKDSETK